ncbi:MAG: DUF3040 domain-containing protein [Acidimicrobiales bacterium]
MTPDARLSAAERAALADLEAAALADDPVFASRLRGTPVSEAMRAVSSARLVLRRGWVRLLCVRWWGLVMVVAGLAAVIGGLAVSLAVSLAGVAVSGVGLRVLAEIVVDRSVRRGVGSDQAAS